MYVLLEFWQKIMAIPIMNPLSWFVITVFVASAFTLPRQDDISNFDSLCKPNLIVPRCIVVLFALQVQTQTIPSPAETSKEETVDQGRPGEG